MAYDDEQARRSRVVVETPNSRREVTQTEAVRNDRGGISGATVGVIVVVAIALITIVVLFLMNGQSPDTTNANLAAQQQPAQQPPVIVQQPVVTPALTPAPQPVQQPVVQPTAPAPQPAVVEAPKTKEGDLITSGSEDVPARMLRRASVPYPPLARLQRVQGTVLISALISETGRVLDLKVVRAIGKPVGLNEAAMQIVRGSIFSPPMKDGVHVKSWTTVPVDFKL